MQAVVGVVGAGIGYAVGGAAGAWKGLEIGLMLGGMLYPPASLAGPRALAGMHLTLPQKGQVLPVLYGRMRMAGTIIWYGNPQVSDTSGAGGSGGAKGQGQCSVGLAIALAEGRVSNLHNIWSNGDKLVLVDTNCDFWFGEGDQALDTYMSGYLTTLRDPAYTDADGNWLPGLSPTPGTYAETPQYYLRQVPARYPYICYIVMKDFPTGGGLSIPNLTYEISRTAADLSTKNPALVTLGLDGYAEDANGDMNPVVCLADYLTHPRYGMGCDASELDAPSWQAVASWCETEGLYASPVLDASQESTRHIETLLTYFDGILVYSQGLYKLRYRHTPARESLDYAVITENDWLEHPTFSRPVDRQVPNIVAIEGRDRANAYNNFLTERSDDWDIGARGPYRMQISLPGVQPAVADKLATKFLFSRVVSPLQGQVKVGAQGGRFEPADLFALHGTAFDSLEQRIFRILSISEQVPNQFTLSFVEER